MKYPKKQFVDKSSKCQIKVKTKKSNSFFSLCKNMINWTGGGGGGDLNTWGFGRLARLCSPSSSNNNLDFIKYARGVDRGEVSAHAVFGEDKPSNRRIARIGLVGGEKDNVGESGSNPPHVWTK